MRIGDLVRMKYEAWALMKARKARTENQENIGIVYDIAGKGLKVLMPTGEIKVGLTTQWETLNDHHD